MPAGERTPQNASRQWRRADRWVLPAIVLLGAVLRLANLGGPSLWYDEAASLYLGQYVTDPAALFDATKNTEPPVNALLTGAWSMLVNALSPTAPTDRAHDFLLRLLPCLFGILNCVLVYGVTRQLFASRRTAWCAALLFAVAPFQIHYAQELRVYSLYITLCLAAVWCMARALEHNRMGYWAGFVAALSLLMYSHYFSMWLIFTLNVAFVLMLGRYRRHFWRWTAANALVMALIAPALYRAFAMHAEVQSIEIAWYPNPTWKTALITFKTFFAGFTPLQWVYWPLFLLGSGLWAWGVLSTRRRLPGPILVACLSCLPILGGLWLWGRADFSFYEHRLFLFSGVAALMGVARGIVLLGRPGLLALGLYLVLTVPALASYYQGDLHPVRMHRLAMWDKVDFRGAAAALEARWAPGDRLVYTSHFSVYPMRHYFSGEQFRAGWGPQDQQQFIRTMGHEALLRAHQLMPVLKEEAIAGANRIWFLRTHGITFEWQPTAERIQACLKTVATPGEPITLDGVTLTPFELRK